MKKIFALILALIMCFGIFVACGDEEESSGGEKRIPLQLTIIKSLKRLWKKLRLLSLCLQKWIWI